MILGSVYAEGHSNNSLFEEADPTHRFNPTYTNRLLREEFRRGGIEINTADLNESRQVDFELHFEGRALGNGTIPRFLVALENPLINPLNASRDYFARFRRVFSWNPRFAGVDNFTQISVPNRFVHKDWPVFEEREIFSCLINANKRFKATTSNDLYAERVAVIRWYERNASAHFALYGLGWGKPSREPGLLGGIRRRAQRVATQLFGYKPFPSWKGEIADKSAVLLKAKFAYCFENVYGISGYVTEKIIDCLMNGCIPVYWGADDIADRIPPECFVDRRHFPDTAAVHGYLMAMSSAEYTLRQKAIRSFLASNGARQFSSEYFVRVIVDEVIAQMELESQSVRYQTERV